MMLASLPMYDHPAVRDATNRFWSAIRNALGEGPEELTRTGDVWDHWLHPELLVSQTCGYPYRAKLHGQVTLVGTPDYGLRGCGPGEYNSIFIARANDPRDDLTAFDDACFAYNEAMSQSGWAAPLLHARGQGVTFGRFLQTGGHAISAKTVADGRADLASLDALSWKLMKAHDPFSADLKEIAHTSPTPALPYITARHRDAEAILMGLRTAIDTLSSADRAALSLEGIVSLSPDAYLNVPSPPPPPVT